MRSLDKLLDESQHGVLSEEEFTYIVQKLEAHQANQDSDNLYKLILTLGRADILEHPRNKYSPPRGVKYRKLIESFLYYPSNPDVSALALEILCHYWNFAHEYLKEIKQFINGVEWDIINSVKLQALYEARNFLEYTKKKDPELIQVLSDSLLKSYEDEDYVLAEAACEALEEASGLKWGGDYSGKIIHLNLDIRTFVKKVHETLGM